ncbi:hypothetical protein [Streptomyces solicathayae]|uniref:Uncharacterized protein n=1 Tax=Streptomyces solicathayae TaxID=3081768 RepID=A0ABZ0LQI7_9ACTN|nr:hypothetical protein [Streptomyces sp. HUAS YS2]WOX21753.1 hypothetical protein R2D22_10210 [Streptomyces sp. HUAS YS2]
MPEQFDGKPLDALYAMIAFARPGELTARGEALAKAVPELQKIAKDLRHYIGRVQWDGAAGDAFRVWGADMVAQTLRLGDYTNTAATELTRAGQALREAKTALPKPTGTCFEDPTKEAARVAAETGPKLQEAIHQMERLSSYYEVAKERLDAAKEPRFRPIDNSGFDDMERPYATAGRDAPALSAAALPVPPAAPSRGPLGPGDASLRLPADHLPVGSRPDQAKMTLDSVSGAQGRESTHLVAQPTAHSPSVLEEDRWVTSPLTTQVPGRSSPEPRSGLRPGIASGSSASGAAGVSATRPRSFPGLVIGPEPVPRGRSVVPQPGGPESAVRRELPNQAGRLGSSGRAANPVGGPGFVPAAMAPPNLVERRSSTGRPAYLSEDEETWTSGQRNVMPPVID